MSARARIHAMVNLSEYGETVLDERLDAHRAEVLAADGQAYDGELAMLRGLVRVLRVVARQDDLAEVQRLLIEHARDETAARAEEKATAEAATAAPDFFQPGHAYTHRDGTDFKCVAVTAHPQTGERLAMGWRVDSWTLHYPATVGINQWNHEYDGVQPPTSTEGGSRG